MLKQIKNTWIYMTKEFLQILGVTVTTGLATIVLVFIIVACITSKDERTYAMFGAMFAFMMFLFISIFVGILQCQSEFDMMISMGRTRKEFFISYAVVNLINTGIVLAVIVGLTYLEQGVAAVFYRGYTCEIDFAWLVLNAKVLLGAWLLVPAVRLFGGALCIIFKMKVFWVLWAAMMLFGVWLRMTPSGTGKSEFIALAGKIKRMGNIWQIIIMAVIAAVLFAASYFLLRKRRVGN